LDVINPMAEQQKAKGLIQITTESGEIMWVHTYIIQDEQWETSKLKLKGKSCNIVSLATDNDSVTIVSLRAQKKRNLPYQHSLPHCSRWVHVPVNSTCDSTIRHLTEHPQPTASGNAVPVQAQCPRIRRSRRRFALMNSWRRILLEDSMLLFALTCWHNWPISQLVLPCTSYSASWRKRERHLGMLLLIHNHLWHKYSSLQKKRELHAFDVIWYNSRYHVLPSLLRICSSKTTDKTGPCIIHGTSCLHTLREYKLIQGLL